MNDNGDTPDKKHEVKIDYDGTLLTVVVPVALGKIAVYGALQMALELASKIFWAIEKKEVEAKGLLSKLTIPGARTH